jgi:hypothetical protein
MGPIKTSYKNVFFCNRLLQLLEPVLFYMEADVSILSTVLLFKKDAAEYTFFTNSKIVFECRT